VSEAAQARLKAVVIPVVVLQRLITLGAEAGPARCVSGLPEGAHIEELQYKSGTILIFASHPSFEEVEPDNVPVIPLAFDPIE